MACNEATVDKRLRRVFLCPALPAPPSLPPAPTRLLLCLQSRVHPKTQTPVISVLFCGCVSAVLALFVPLEELSDLTSMGALFAFCVVCAGVFFR